MNGVNVDVGAFEVVIEESAWDSVYAVQQDVVGQLLLYNNIIVNNFATIGNLNTIPNNGTNLYQDTNNIFVGQNNYKLASNSPAIDAGDNQYVNFSKDLSGDTRIACGNVVDQGAFEMQPENYSVGLTAHTVMDVTCSGHITTLTASGGERYTWSHSNETSNTVTVNPLVPACYTVTAYRDHVCLWSDTATICIDPDETIENSIGSPSTAGRRFWVSFMRNYIGNPSLSLLISSQTNCTGTVTNPSTGWSVPFSVIANETTRLAIPNDQAYCHSDGTVLDRGLLVTSTDNISLYASNFRDFTYDVSNVLPETALSDEYVAQAYTPLKNTEFLIVATADSTEVEITPTCITSDDHHAYIPYTVVLNQGQVYQVVSKFGGMSGDLSGSVIRSSDMSKPIAVFNGNVCTNVPSGNPWCDHVVEQAFGTRYWGRQFVVTNTMGMPYDRVKVTAADDNTRLIKDGIQLATLNAHQTYEFELSSTDTACFLECTKACAAYLYVAGGAVNPGTNRGDPSMVWISPLEQRINEITFSTFNSPNITHHYVNIVSPSATVRSVTLDNNYIWEQFRPVVSNPMYKYARIKIPDGTHTLSSNGGIVAHVYGTGYCETYAYSVGSKAAVLSEQMFVNQVLSSELESNEFCTYEDIIFDAVTNYQCDSVLWDFGDGTGKHNGYHFTHHYTQAGTYTVSMTVFLYDNFGQHCTTLYSQMVVHDGYNVIWQDTVCQGVFYQGYGFDYAADSAGLITLSRTVDIPGSECDSTYVLELFVIQGVFDYYDTICAGNDYNGYGFHLSQALPGAYLLTDTVSRTPCDSITVLHLLVTPHTNDIYGIHGMEYVCPGNTYTYWLDTLSGLTGIEWTFPAEAHIFSGQGTDHITVTFTENTLGSNITATGANSCGTASFTMTVFPQPVYYITIEDTVCGIGQPYHKYGFDIDSVIPDQPIYIRNMLSESCCDSTVVLSLLVVDLPNVVIQADTYHLCHNDVVELTAVCVTESMDWMDTSYNVSLAYLWNTGDTTKTIMFSSDTSLTASVSVTNDYGCSVNADTLITIFPIHHAFDTLTICESLLPYTYADTVFEEGTVSGDFVFEGSDIFGCDSLLMLHFTVNISSVSDTDVVACASFTWYDSIYTQSGDYTTYLTAANGCDSIVTLHLTVNHPTTYVDEQDVCDSLRWIDGNLYTESIDTATFTLTNAAGCDSVVTLHLTVRHSTSYVDEQDVCDSLRWIDGNLYTESTDTATFTLTNAAGCDSVVTLHLTVRHSTSHVDEEDVCDSLRWIDGNLYTESTDTATFTLTNAAGCDSIVTLHLTVNHSTASVDEQDVCDSLRWIDGNLYTESTDTVTFTLTNAAGCDSVVTLHLTVRHNTASVDERDVCDSLRWIDGNLYTESTDTATFTLTNAAGCDSVVTLHLTVRHSTSYVDERDVCDSLRWIDGNLYTESTETATFTQTNAAGCDSIITLHLTVNHPTAAFLTMAVMENNLPYELNGEPYNQSGVYVQHLTSAAGCDSTLTLQLTVYNNQTLMMDSAVCESMLPLTWNDSVFTSAGTKTRIYPASNGADSTVVMNLTVLPNPTAADTMVLYATMLPYYLALADTLIPASIPGPLHLFYWDTAATGCDTLVSLVVLIEETQPLAVSVEGTENTDCYGVGCEYHGPTILINEVALIPSTGDGSIAGSFDTYAGEWLELYNPHKCESVDISCYFLGNNAKDYNPTLTAYGGGFTLPQGTVVPPQGFCLVRGMNAPAVPSNLLVQNGGNVVEVVVDTGYCFGGGIRLWFPNAGGWFAFYDANGVVQDAIYWADSNNFCSTCPPCVSSGTGCGFSGTLASFSQIPYSKKNYIGNNLTQGQSLRRVPDGGSWSTQSAAPTYATCNDTCVGPPVITCNAIAVAHVSGGVAPYTYLWNDFLLQTTDTATGLCAGTYAVTVTDALGDTAVAQVAIENFVPQVSHSDILACLSDSLVVLQGLPAGGTYSGGVMMGDTLALSPNVSEYQMTYTYVNEQGCAGSAQFHVNVTRNVQEMDTVVCSSELPFLWHGQSLTASGTYQRSTPMDSVCDSLLVLHLSVVQQPQLMVDHNVVIEPGDSATLHTSGANSYLWTPAVGLSDTTSASPVASPAQSTLYFVTGFTSDFCSSMDSVQVLVIQYADTTICENDLPLNWFGLTFVDTTAQTVTVTHENALPEVFQLQVHLLPVSYSSQHDTVPENNLPTSFNGLFFADDVDTVLIIPNSYGCDSIINYSLYVCHNQTVTVDSTICESDLPLLWNDQVLPCAGEYQAELQTSCGSDSLVSLHLSVIDTSVRLSSLTDNFCDELMAELEVESPMTNYVWSTGETSPNITVNLPGLYSVTVSQGDCRNMAEIIVENCDVGLYLPNAITPVHSNGLNDYFSIPEIFQQTIRRFEIRIYDRWGVLVFYSTDKNFRWNGEYNGQIYHNSMFNYIIQYTDSMGKHQRKGSIMVL